MGYEQATPRSSSQRLSWRANPRGSQDSSSTATIAAFAPVILAMSGSSSATPRCSAKDKINQHLRQSTIVREPQEIDIDFVSLEYKKIVEQLKVFLPFVATIEKGELREKLRTCEVRDEAWRKYFTNADENELTVKDEFISRLVGTRPSGGVEKIIGDMLRESLTKFEVSQNGLGYNNLIFIATVLGDIIERKGAESESYVALLIEEPEAHLHPQLQDTLFNYFRSINEKNIQVFVTSHSPTITAKTNIDSLIVMERQTPRKLKSTALHDIVLEKDESTKLERFLDVTKCQLFFATGVILVEGISEALIATAVGLLVAIPAIVMHNYFVGRINRTIKGAESLAKIVLSLHLDDYLKSNSSQESYLAAWDAHATGKNKVGEEDASA